MIDTYIVPVSVKGLVIENGKVWLRKNEREEWELPGGKLEEGEQPEQTVIREMQEELGYVVNVLELRQAHIYTVKQSIDESHGVLVVTYLCEVVKKVGDFEFIGEGGKAEFQQFAPDELDSLNIPDFYKSSIAKVFSKED
ncbi:MAG: NUDIX hydrolase [Candidatus Levybacteria bacterium]|nr:NUDIX hydrolase [Candidatus Levybacteria bacterium]